MKKKIAYLTATALACVTIFGAASCGNKGGDSVADLEIYFCQSGAGTEYFEKIVDAFKVKNPDINVVEPLIVNSDYNYLKTALEIFQNSDIFRTCWSRLMTFWIRPSRARA